MAKKETVRPELPKVRRHKWRDAGWLAMEPAKLGTVVACFSAGLALLFLFVRQRLGTPMPIGDVALGVVKTFVVSYVATGLFVLYLLWVAERELAPPEESKKLKSLKEDEDGGVALLEDDEAAQEDAQTEIDVMAEALDRLGPQKGGAANDAAPRDPEEQ